MKRLFTTSATLVTSLVIACAAMLASPSPAHAFPSCPNGMSQPLEGFGNYSPGGGTSSATAFGQPHVFYRSYRPYGDYYVRPQLRHAFNNGAWQFETLDSSATMASAETSTVVSDHRLDVFYSEDKGTTDLPEGILKHGWYDDRVGYWQFERVDGDSTSGGRVNADVARRGGIASVMHEGALHVFYLDATNHQLRHAWQGGDGIWHFQNLRAADVFDIEALEFSWGQLHVIYKTASGLWDTWTPGPGTWQTDGLDTNVGAGGSAVIMYAGQLHVFSPTASWSNGRLRHLWWDGQWNGEILDLSGFGSVVDVGAALEKNGQLNVFYANGTGSDIDARRAWWDGSKWQYETTDGDYANPLCGTTENAVGRGISATVFNATTFVFYDDWTAHGLRVAELLETPSGPSDVVGCSWPFTC